METTTLETTGTTVELTKTEKEVLAYLNKTAKHLFVTEDNYFFKVMPIEIGGKWFYITMKFDGEKSVTQITSVSDKIKYHEEHTKRMIKTDLFPQHYDKKISITNFKAMRELMEDVEIIAKKFTGLNSEKIKLEIKKVLLGMQFVKKDEE